MVTGFAHQNSILSRESFGGDIQFGQDTVLISCWDEDTQDDGIKDKVAGRVLKSGQLLLFSGRFQHAGFYQETQEKSSMLSQVIMVIKKTRDPQQQIAKVCELQGLENICRLHCVRLPPNVIYAAIHNENSVGTAC